MSAWLTSQTGVITSLIGLFGTAAAALWSRWSTRKTRKMDDIKHLQELSRAALERAEAQLQASEDQRERDKLHYRKRIHRMEKVVAGPVAELIKWVDDGANPPPPEITEEIRGLIAVLSYWSTDHE